ncbi:hypothetical protein [Hyphomicrobium sp. LHD-15]|uniref:hypothetical protein n=1 Tax=Hyphomicrobium sp. LHD-15 TaxID=3072142 RepID=UPI00280D9B9E|nr:hypothetical protein [Hyphomicrobium sp. LHD-15]MDQ8700592.1 hypothetical protein [Hyphomicrobium sp. LHD-15]
MKFHINMAVTRLPDLYGQPLTAIMLSPLFLDDIKGIDETAIKPLAKPWFWEKLDGTAGLEFRTLIGRTLKPLDLAMPESDQEAIREKIDKIYDALYFSDLDAQPIERPIFLAKVPETGPEPGQSAPVVWAHALESLARQPGQVGRILRVTHFLKYGGSLRLIKPPAFQVKTTKGTLGLTPKRFKVLDKNSVSYDYEHVASEDFPELAEGVTFSATICFDRFQGSLSADEDDPEIDPKTLWVSFPSSGRSWTGDDWFAALPIRLVEAMDLVDHLDVALGVWSAGASRDAEVQREEAKLVKRLFAFCVGFGAGTGRGQEREPEWTADLILRAIAEDARAKHDVNLDKVLKLLAGNLKDAAADDSYDARLEATDFDAEFATLRKIAASVAAAEGSEIQWRQAEKILDIPNGEGNGPTRQSLADVLRTMGVLLRSQRGAAGLLLQAWGTEIAAAVHDGADQPEEFAKRETELKDRISAAVARIALRQRLTIDRIRPLLERNDAEATEAVKKVAKNALKEVRKNFDLPLSSVAVLQERAMVFVLKRFAGAMSGTDAGAAAENEILGGFSDSLAARVASIGTESKASLADIDLGAIDPVTVPQPLTFVVGNLADTGSAAATSPEPFKPENALSRFVGIGVLVRIMTSAGAVNSPWYCPTLGAFRAIGESDKPGDLITTGHAPWRVVSQNGLEGWVVTYSGLPITAIPVVADLNAKHSLQSNSQKLAKPTHAVFQIRKADSGASSRWWKIPALGYGRTYEFAFFGQTNAGALPAELTDGVDCGRFRLPDTVPSAIEGRATRIKLRYLRRTPVGAPRLVPIKNDDDRFGRKGSVLAIPPIPRAEPWPVFPLAEDLIGRPEMVVDDPILDSEADRYDDTFGPIILLRPAENKAWKEGQSEFEFGVVPPAVSTNDFVVWRSADLQVLSEGESESSASKAARNEIASLLRESIEPSKVQDESPDDPAVEFFRLQVWKVNNQVVGQSALVVDKEIKFPLKPPVKNEIKDWQSRTYPIAVKVGKNQDVKMIDGTPAGGSTIFVSEGGLYRIAITSMVDRKFFDEPEKNGNAARFRTLPPLWFVKQAEGAGRQLRKDTDKLKYGDRYAVSATYLTVEVATLGGFEVDKVDKEAQLKRRRVLYEQIAPLETQRSPLEIGLRNNWPKDDRISPYAKRSLLRCQLWSWSGRSFGGDVTGRLEKAFVDDERKMPPGSRRQGAWIWQDKGDQSDAWKDIVSADGQLFGDRTDTEALISTGLLMPPKADVAAAALAMREEAAMDAGLVRVGPTHRIDMDLDRRAQYWRFSARIESRYAGLLAEELRPKARINSPWRRLLLKARPRDRMPKPSVRFILPLTQSIGPAERPDGSPATPEDPRNSLLVMLDEAWGSHAGLAEKLNVQVVAWEEMPGSSAHQFGFDPIVSAKTADPSIEVSTRWPFGLTFDANVKRPQIAASCFELRIPTPMTKGTDVMAQVRFQRGLVASMVDAANQVSTYESEWTQPEWVIFNRDARYWRVKKGGEPIQWRDAQELNIRGSEVLLNAQPIAILADDPEPDSKMVRDVYLVITVKIKEADGTEGEVFYNLKRITKNGFEEVEAAHPSAIKVDEETARFVGRLLEIEIHKSWRSLYRDMAKRYDEKVGQKPSARDHELWMLLFPSDDGEHHDAIARIRRVSPPLGIKERSEITRGQG